MERMLEGQVNQVVQAEVGLMRNELAKEPPSASLLEVGTEVYRPFMLEQLNEKTVTVVDMARKNYAAGYPVLGNEWRPRPVEGWNESPLNGWAGPENAAGATNTLLG